MPTETRNSQIKNLAQKRAKFAYEQVSRLKSEPWAGEFKSHVKDVPMMIKTNGFAAAYAFVFSKKDKKDYQEITVITEKWLVEEQKIIPKSKQENIPKREQDFDERLIHLSPEKYRYATREILTLFTWLKRYADGMIEKESNQENPNQKPNE